jgi:adenylate cyclase
VKKLILCLLLLIPGMLRAQDEEKITLKPIPELSRALESEFKTLKTAENLKDKKLIGRSMGTIGGLYLDIARQTTENTPTSNLISNDKKINLNKSMEYSNKSIEASDEVGDVEQLKISYKNLNAAQKLAGNVKGAMASYAKLVSLKKTIFGSKKSNEYEKKQMAYDHAKREDSIKHQQQLAEERLNQQKQVLAQQQQQIEATNKNLSEAEKQKQAANIQLQKTQSDLNTEKTNSQEKDKQLTLAEEQQALQAAKLQMNQKELEMNQKVIEMNKKELDQQKKERIYYILGLAALVGICLLIFFNFRAQKKYNAALGKEKKRSEELLLNILPQEVAEELMEKGFADAKHFYDVTVLFTDFVSFTHLAETMSPKELVGELHVCFKAFDQILSKYHIEKIKTVGDAYMAVAGLPIANPNHATDIAAASIEIRDFMAARKKELGNGTFGIRIGINSGNVVAGIVGVRKFAYDIWGDTVNIAARMEQNSEEGKINISDTTYQLVKEKYPCIYRGKVDAKNKGSVDMYYLT